MSPQFIEGMELCALFYSECVAPLMEAHFGEVEYSAARLGGGSDVLGFDTPQSRDHDWGPQVDLFLEPDVYSGIGRKIYNTFAGEMPFFFRGYSTNFENDYLMGDTESRPIVHRVKVHSIESYFAMYLGFNPDNGISEIDWLRTPSQLLRTVRSGRVFYDGLNKLETIRGNLNWYPDDIWYYLLACQWRRIDQEEPFTARCGDTGDELGSRIVAARQSTEIMRLCFLTEKEYAPYSKWFGTGFNRLKCSKDLTPLLSDVFVQTNWKDRERLLTDIYLTLGEMHNSLSITEPISAEVSQFHNRPYMVPHSARYVDALSQLLKSPMLKSLERPIGSVGQFVDSTDIFCWNDALKSISSVYTDNGAAY